MLYTCAKEFDFLGTEMPLKATYTLLLPAAIASCLLFVFHYFIAFVQAIINDELNNSDEKEKEEEKEEKPTKNGSKKKEVGTSDQDWTPAVDPAVFYNLIQMCVYAVMAIMIMRLKLFWSPQLCIVSGLIASEKVKMSHFIVF